MPLDTLAELADAASPPIALEEVQLLAPLAAPPQFIGVGLNYRDHAAESGLEVPIAPVTFAFLASSVADPGAPIVLPRFSDKIDWEVEIGVVIGRPAFRVSQANAMDHVAGYTILNDVSARDHMKRADWPFFSSDWFNQKVFDTSAPTGPWITPASNIADPHDLTLKTWVNDDLMQDSSSRYMVFNIPEQIESLSRQMTLLPGDIIATGTCTGVGGARDTYLKAGDRVRMEIEGLGTLENPVEGPRES